MPATTLYFAQLDPTWHDWVQVVNVGNAPARVTCIGRNIEAKTIWTAEHTLPPYHTWTPAVDAPKQSVSLEVRSDGQPIVVRQVATARVVIQRSQVVKPFGWWEVGDQVMGGAVQGTVEVVSTQPIVGERHLHYKGGQIAVGQLGQVLEA